MSLATLSVRRPVLAGVLSLLLIVLGIGAALQLPIREYPDIDPPIVSVSTTYAGASAAVVERDVTEIIEDNLNGIDGVEQIVSTSRDGLSQVDIEFALGRDLDGAAADVRDRVGAVASDLPDDADPPVIAKTEADQDAMMWLRMTSDIRDPLALTDFAERNLVDPLGVVPGVARVQIGGEKRYAMRLWLDPAAMAARGLTVADVTAALRRENVELPAGELETGAVERSVRTVTRFASVDDFARLVLREGEGGRVLLEDVARIEIGPEEQDRGFLADGRPSIGLGIVRQSGSNTLAVAQAVRDELERLRPSIPDDVEVEVSFDESVFVQGSVREVIKTLLITTGLVVAVVFLFLGSLKGTLIPAVTIPVSLTASFIVLALLGFSINTLTLLALVLAIGLVVDDAIVVLENVTRHREEGQPRFLAAADGTAEVGFAVITTTIVLIAVFVPLAFLTGTVGRLFREFAVTLAAAVAFSSFVALTLGAALAGRLVETRDEGLVRRLGRWIDRGFGWLERGYMRMVGWTVDALPLMVVLIGLGAGGIWLAYRALPQELAPTEDRGVFIVRVELPEGASFARTRAVVEEITRLIAPYAEGDGPVEATLAIIGLGREGPPQTEEALVITTLRPWSERAMGQVELVEELRPKLLAISAARVIPINPPSLVQQGGFSQPVQFVIGGPDYATAQGWARTVLEAAEAEGLLESASLDFAQDSPQLQLKVNRALAADLGVDARTVAETLQVFLAGQDVTEYVDRNETYEVVVRGEPGERRRPEDLSGVYVRSGRGDLVSLATLIDIEEVGTAPERQRVDRQPSVTLSGVPAPGRDLGSVLARLDGIVAERLPREARISYLDLAKEFQESSAGVFVTFALALLIVYLVLAGLFESFIHPVTIMVAVPLALAGGLGALVATGQSFNTFAQVSLLLLTGLLAKNAILIVDFANQRRAQGEASPREAALAAARTRFRPILMTSIATFFGAVPLALATGPGAESRAVIGIVVMAGIVVATLVTLFVVPTLYNALGRLTTAPGAADAQLARERREVEQGAE